LRHFVWKKEEEIFLSRNCQLLTLIRNI
jgi:hypothetical protein